jgi:hypothetical protein
MIVPRPPKELGNQQYTKEVEQGKLDIIDVELDEDFDKLYGLVNGNIDNDNISAVGPRIIYEKLNLAGKIQNSDLAASFTLPGTAYPPNTVPGTSIVNNSIGPAQLTDGVFVDSINNLGLFTTVSFQQCPFRSDSFLLTSGGSTSGGPVILHTLDITNSGNPGTRGGPIFAIGYVAVSCQLFPTSSVTVHARLRFGAPPTPAVVQEHALFFSGNSQVIPATLVVPFITGLQSGTRRVQIEAQVAVDVGNANCYHSASALLVCEQA